MGGGRKRKSVFGGRGGSVGFNRLNGELSSSFNEAAGWSVRGGEVLHYQGLAATLQHRLLFQPANWRINDVDNLPVELRCEKCSKDQTDQAAMRAMIYDLLPGDCVDRHGQRVASV